VTLRKDGDERLYAIEESAAAPPFALMRFAGYDSPEAVKALNGAELLVSREDAAPLQPGEFYVEDLKGLAVIAGGDSTGGFTISVGGVDKQSDYTDKMNLTIGDNGTAGDKGANGTGFKNP
jgi:16S rRNA processing protein RimM